MTRGLRSLWLGSMIALTITLPVVISQGQKWHEAASLWWAAACFGAFCASAARDKYAAYRAVHSGGREGKGEE